MTTTAPGAKAPTMTLLEVAKLLSSPASAVCAASTNQQGGAAPLSAVGFPRPSNLLHGRPTWSRGEVEAFAADPARLAAAVRAARKGLVGLPFFVDGGSRSTFEA